MGGGRDWKSDPQTHICSFMRCVICSAAHLHICACCNIFHGHTHRWVSFQSEICTRLAAGDAAGAVAVYRDRAWPNLFGDWLDPPGGLASHMLAV